MMTNSLPTLPSFRFKLLGKKVALVHKDDEGIGIQLEHGWSIAIWAQFLVAARDGIPNSDIQTLVNAKIMSFVGDDTQESLVFDNGVELIIQIDGDVPEAMAVYGPDNITVNGIDLCKALGRGAAQGP